MRIPCQPRGAALPVGHPERVAASKSATSPAAIFENFGSLTCWKIPNEGGEKLQRANCVRGAALSRVQEEPRRGLGGLVEWMALDEPPQKVQVYAGVVARQDGSEKFPRGPLTHERLGVELSGRAGPSGSLHSLHDDFNAWVGRLGKVFQVAQSLLGPSDPAPLASQIAGHLAGGQPGCGPGRCGDEQERNSPEQPYPRSHFTHFFTFLTCYTPACSLASLPLTRRNTWKTP